MENKCKICPRDKGSNKGYCSLECRYKDSAFKNTKPWNSKENLEKSPERKALWIETQEKAALSRRESYHSGKSVIWNKGLTKETNESLANIAKNRMGENNPVHKLLSDEVKTKKWKENLSKANIGRNKGLKLIEILGEEKAEKAKKKMSDSAKIREIHGHTGKKHSEESKAKMRAATVALIASGKFKHKFTEPMKIFLQLLTNLNLDSNFKIEYDIKYYLIDFACQDLKLAIEIDGDFWHCNPNTRHALPKTKSQIKNLKNDKRKEKYLKTKGWHLIRFWEADLYNEIDQVKTQFLKTWNELSKIKQVNS